MLRIDLSIHGPATMTSFLTITLTPLIFDYTSVVFFALVVLWPYALRSSWSPDLRLLHSASFHFLSYKGDSLAWPFYRALW